MNAFARKIDCSIAATTSFYSAQVFLRSSIRGTFPLQPRVRIVSATFLAQFFHHFLASLLRPWQPGCSSPARPGFDHRSDKFFAIQFFEGRSKMW